MLSKTFYNARNKKVVDIDLPEELPVDPKLAFTQYMTKIRTANQMRQMSRSVLLNQSIAPLNDSRFEPFKNISEWNGKYNSGLGQPFMKSMRNTDIPGTVIN